MMGHPDAAVRECREHVRAAIENSHRATRRKSYGSNHQVTDSSVEAFENQNQQRLKEYGFGLQFPNKSYLTDQRLSTISKGRYEYLAF